MPASAACSVEGSHRKRATELTTAARTPACFQVGDGTTTVVLLAAQFLKECKAFVEEGVHPQVGSACSLQACLGVGSAWGLGPCGVCAGEGCACRWGHHGTTAPTVARADDFGCSYCTQLRAMREQGCCLELVSRMHSRASAALLPLV